MVRPVENKNRLMMVKEIISLATEGVLVFEGTKNEHQFVAKTDDLTPILFYRSDLSKSSITLGVHTPRAASVWVRSSGGSMREVLSNLLDVVRHQMENQHAPVMLSELKELWEARGKCPK